MFATYDKFERNTSFNGLSICNEIVQHIKKPIEKTTTFYQSFKIACNAVLLQKLLTPVLRFLQTMVK